MQFIILTRRRTEAFHESEYTRSGLRRRRKQCAGYTWTAWSVRSGIAVSSAAHVFSRKPPRA